jgi:hypothetical protein
MRKVYSHTKRSALAKCPRIYFYEYYATNFKPPVREPQMSLFEDVEPKHAVLPTSDSARASELSGLTSGPQQGGLILHDLISQSLKNPDWQASWFYRKANENFYGRNGSTVRFVERFNGLPDAEKRLGEAKENMLHAMKNFFESPVVRSLVESLRYGDEHLMERPLGGWAPVLEFSVMGRIDYCVRLGEHVDVVDWKMGRSTGDEDSLQLAVYGIWAMRHFNVPAENVRVRRVFLGDAKIEEAKTLSERRVNRAEARLRQDVEQMAELHPYGLAGHEEAFTPSPKEKVCETCKFQKLCPLAACMTR